MQTASQAPQTQDRHDSPFYGDPTGTGDELRRQDRRHPGRGWDQKQLAGPLLLIGLGALFLLEQVFNFGWLVLPVLAASFLTLGLATRQAGWLIPGGILGGLSLGIALTDGPFRVAGAGSEERGGLFLLAFALGWASISLLSKLFTREPQTWALIPGGLMALIGLAVLADQPGLQVLRWLGALWPVGLIAAGVYLLYRGRRRPA
jgi:hypothetical protein